MNDLHDPVQVNVDLHDPLQEAAYREGYRDAVANYSIWKNGEQVVGCLEKPLKSVIEEFNGLKVPVRY